jgi:serine protease Do
MAPLNAKTRRTKRILAVYQAAHLHCAQRGAMVRKLLGALWLTSIALCCSNVQAAVSPELQQAIRASTFEVVMKKPDKDPATYEKALPLDLLPFHERTDAYRSVGTAFSLGHNIYVTAAHVLGVGIDSQYGMPQLRGSDGTIFSIDRILRFSLHEDFVVFSLQSDPAPTGFSVNREPKIDDPVLAVGNALGEGIVIRDGLYTSATDEDQDGRWKWIRFSAAASPGNSGGPLLDGDGRVVGIVIGKSPNENLNYSLPINRVLDGEDHQATFDQRVLTSLPYLHGTYTYTYQDAFKLPQAWPAFVAAYQSLFARHTDEARTALLKTYSDSLFPKGAGSESLLFDSNSNGFNPLLIMQQADGSWSANNPDYTSTNLPGDGSVNVAAVAGATLLRLIRSNAAADDAFYGDSKAFMDLALKGLNVRRAVGPDQVRITSLGTAQSDSIFVDSYGRRWQERIWAVPFLDIYIVGLLLPSPDGYDAIILYSPSSLLRATENQARLLTGQLGVSLSGSLKQWQAYLRRRALLPDTFREVALDQSPDWTLRTRRFISIVPVSVLPLTETSPLTLTMGFTNSGGHLVWDIADLWWDKDPRMDAAVGLWRRERPPSRVRLEIRNNFDSMRDRRSPYDGQMVRDTADTFSVSQIMDAPGKVAGKVSSDLLYGLTLRMVGHPTIQDAEQSLQRLASANHILEHGIGADVVAPTSTGSAADAAYVSSMQQAIAAAEQMEPMIGNDIRGHRLSQDIRDFYEAQRASSRTIPVGSSAAESFDTLHRQQYQALQDYWHQYPGVAHNRDLWSIFLARNAMPPDTPHQKEVTDAENALRSVLDSGTPSADWSLRAHDLRVAYVQERRRVLMGRNSAVAAYRSRVLPCSPSADKTSGKKSPIVGRMNSSLEDFWPLESKRLGEEGLVMVSLRISATGCAMAVALAGSSGSEMLDEAVMHFYETIDFIPGEVDGKPVESTVTMPIIFKLEK